MNTAVSPPEHILAALRRCPHCPFLAKWSEHAEGIQRDDTFDVENVDLWIDSKPWQCHKHLDLQHPCAGQKLFKAGRLPVTREELIEIWVDEKSPGE